MTDDEINLLPLGNSDHVVLIDSDDYPLLSRHNWTLTKTKRWSYATTKLNRNTIKMHTLIMGTKKRPLDVIDHISGDRLDNRKSNLRFCSNAQNIQNMRKIKPKSGYRGVYPNAQGTWNAQIRKDGALHYLGRFITKKSAANAYDKKALELYGEYAYVNFRC